MSDIISDKKAVSAIIFAIIMMGGANIGADRIAPVETQQAVQTEQYENLLEKINELNTDQEKIDGKIDAMVKQNTQFQLNQVAMQKDIEINTQKTDEALNTLDERTIPISKIFELENRVEKIEGSLN